MVARPPRSGLPRISSCALVGLGLPVLVGLFVVDHGGSRDEAAESSERPGIVAPAEVEARSDPLRGLWMRYESQAEGSPMRFWYFHGDGKGIYRYGKVGLTNTHSFDYEVSGSEPRVELSLRFRKRDESHAISAVLNQDDRGRTWMILRGDPREPGASYVRVDAETDFAGLAHSPRLESSEEAPEEAEIARAKLGDRLWIDYRNHATGGAEFHLYQFAKTSLDGRGIGWFHRGDFDEWSTESLTYRITGGEIELFFDLREEPNRTVFHLIEAEGDTPRQLLLASDPRDFWAPHRYGDGGRSFDSAAFDTIVGVERWLAAQGE